MTVIDEPEVWATRTAVRPLPGRARRQDMRARRPAPQRPPAGAVRYRGTGVTMSRAPHTRRPVSIAMTVAVAGIAALITIWLGAIAHSGGVSGTPAAVPEQLAVVQVQAGETLQHLAARVAPDAPVAQVVARIRDLNQLESAALDAGQTLIAPVGPSADHDG
ncbi:MAG: LysM peptidoglycan-binding domain-containing protein [Mycobacteriaceae bacterium]|nr:LysM peptidoglycan-binding domain-containing protein [Mycobacteriaceae bacterium]